jgi:hypothetical protein
VPWDHSALTTDFYFAGGGTGTAAAARAPAAAPAPPPAAAAPKTAAIPPVQSKAEIAVTAAARAPRFETNDNVRLEGRVISASRQPNPEACRAACEANELCAGYQHGRRIPVIGQCQILDRIDARLEDSSWRSGVRR